MDTVYEDTLYLRDHSFIPLILFAAAVDKLEYEYIPLN